MTDERTCRCKGQFAMHKPALHADRDGSEARARLEREHERGLAADKVEGRCRICGHGTDSDQLACAPCRAVIAGDRYAKEGWLRAERAEAKVRELQPQVVRLRQGLWDVWAALGHDTDGDTGPGALISGMGVDGFIAMVLRDAQTWRRETGEDYDNDTSRLEAEVERLSAEVEAMPYCSRVYYWREGSRADKAEAALARVEAALTDSYHVMEKQQAVWTLAHLQDDLVAALHPKPEAAS